MVIHGHGATNQGRVAKETTLELSEEENIVQIQFSRESMFIYSRNLRSVVPDCLQGVLLVSALQSCARGEGDTLVGARADSLHPRHHHRPSWPHHWRRDCAGGHPAEEHQLPPHLRFTDLLGCSNAQRIVLNWLGTSCFLGFPFFLNLATTINCLLYSCETQERTAQVLLRGKEPDCPSLVSQKTWFSPASTQVAPPFCENQLTPPYLASGTGFQATAPTCFGRYTESKTLQLVNIGLLFLFLRNISNENILVVSKINVAEKVGNKLL